MKHFNWLVFFLSLLIFPSCNNSSQSNSNSKENKKDTITSINSIEKDTVSGQLQKLLIHFKDTTGFPFVVDSAYIAHVPSHDSLGAKEVNLLSKNLVKDSLMDDANTTIHEFDTIDSLKANGLYSKWVEKLDIGMVQTANAYALNKIKLNDSITVITWAIACTSYPADPIYNFTYIYCTILGKDKFKATFVLGRVLNGADPPIADDQYLYSTLYKNGSLKLDYSDSYYDSDSSITTLNKSHYEYIITDGDFKQVSKEQFQPRRNK